MKKDKFATAMTADEFSAAFRKDPENDRLYRESEIRLEISERMREMRKHLNISQEDLAKRVGRSQPFIAKLEKGGYDRCEISTLRTFARALRHDIDVSGMFVMLEEAVFTGKSSCDGLESAFVLENALCDALPDYELSAWKNGRDVTAFSFNAMNEEHEDIKTAA